MLTAQEICEMAPVIPVLTINDASHAVSLVKALMAGGLPVVEITLRTPAALDAIRATADIPGAVIGAGTLLSVDDIKAAKSAGALFGVSPGTTHELIDVAQKAKMPIIPGVYTPSEVMALLDRNMNMMKFYPASLAGGPEMLKALAAPFPQARFCPTGGITAANAMSYLSLPNVVCVGGSWVAPQAEIEGQAWHRIEAYAREASELGHA